ncbi:hypothetical protein O3P69_001477 [Scylla paramamosain]|uniref:Nephrin n=1 Tax=Scylla paramamosain TaxID=85552 RepID=A0AAW0V1Y7_SCYPA
MKGTYTSVDGGGNKGVKEAGEVRKVGVCRAEGGGLGEGGRGVAAGGAQFSRRRKFSSQPFSAVYLVPPYLPNSRRWIGAEGGGFERGVPGYPRYLYLGEASRGEHHLVIKGATLEDDGEYQCQVGPTDTTPPIWAAANLTVMVSPTSISIVDVGDGGVVEVQEGHTLRLECLVKGARPPAAVTWYRDAITLRKDLHREEVVPSKDSLRWDVRSRLALKVEAGDDGQEFSCRALHPALQHAPTTLVASLTVAVLHPPDPPTITGYRTGDVLAVGDHRTLVCQVKGGRPRPFVTWYRHGRPLTHAPAHQPTSASLTTAVPPTSATTVSTTARERTIRVEQRVTAAREEDEAVYECRVSSDLLTRPLTANVTLTVHYPPEDVTILGPTVVAAGQLFTLTCRSSPANPPPTLTWRLQGTRIASGAAVVSEGAGGGWVTSAQLSHHMPKTPDTTQTTAQCLASHPLSSHLLSQTHVITVIKRPGWPVVEVTGEDELVEGGTQLTVTCTSQGGNPPPALTLYKAGQKVVGVEDESAGGVTRIRAQLRVTRVDNGKQVTCKVTNPATTTPMTSHSTISLRFPPTEVSSWVTPSSVEAGQVATLTCQSSSSVPPSTLVWHSNGVPLTETTHTQSQGLYGGTVSTSEVEVRATAEDHGRVFTCEAANGMGVATNTTLVLDVIHGPMWVWAPEGKVDVTEGEDLIITVLATANPGPVRYSWWRGPEALQNEGHDDDGGQLRLPRTSRRLSGNYTVIARTSQAAINSSFSINVQYGPEDLLAAKRVTVDEDSAATVLCSAAGNPPPNITWVRETADTRPETILSSGLREARLVLEWARKEDTGLYLCYASNSIDSPPPISTAIVVTQAPEPVSSITQTGETERRSLAPIGGMGVLDCRVRAAPSPTFTWTAGDKEIFSDGRKYIIHVPQLVDDVIEWSSVLEVKSVTIRDYLNYTCAAHNSQGSHSVSFTLTPPILPAAPISFNVSIQTSSSVIASWINNPSGAAPDGYLLQYHTTDGGSKELLDVHGSNTTRTIVKGLTPTAEYSFVIQAYNDRGHSNHTSPPVKITMLGGLEEAAVGSSVSGQQPRVSRLIMLLICLTATALFVLNISIIVCFLRRRALKRNVSASSSKTTALEVYTPTSGTLTQGDEFPLTSISEGPPPEYQSIDSQTRLEESEHTCLINSHTNSNTPEPLPPFSGTSSRSRSSSPLLNGGVSGKSDIFLLENDKVSSEDKTTIVASASPQRHEYEQFQETRNVIHSSNNPDVCPTTSDSCDPLLEQQETFNPYEDDQVSIASSQHSSESYGFSKRPHNISSVQYQIPRQPTQVIYHGQPHLQQQLEEEQQLYQKMPMCYHLPSHSPQYNQPHQLPTMRPSFSPSIQIEASGFCEDNCEQIQETAGTSGAYATGQPRRSCLKPSQYNALQRSHSVHSYSYSSLQCVHHHHLGVDQCCTGSFYSNPQLNASHAAVCGKAKEHKKSWLEGSSSRGFRVHNAALSRFYRHFHFLHHFYHHPGSKASLKLLKAR